MVHNSFHWQRPLVLQAVVLLGTRSVWSLLADEQLTVHDGAPGLLSFRKPLLRRQAIVQDSTLNGSILAESLNPKASLRTSLTGGSTREEAEMLVSCAGAWERENVGIHRPDVWLTPDKFDEKTGDWVNCGSSDKEVFPDVVSGMGNVDLANTIGFGAKKKVKSLNGDHVTKLDFGNLIDSDYFTLCTLTRYTGAYRGRILAGSAAADDNAWYFGHDANHVGVARAGINMWLTDPTGKMHGEINKNDWTAMCAKTTGDNSVMRNGATVQYQGRNIQKPMDGKVNVNMLDTPGDPSDFAIAVILVWKSPLTNMQKAMDYLMSFLEADDRTSGSSVSKEMYAPCTGPSCRTFSA